MDLGGWLTMLRFLSSLWLQTVRAVNIEWRYSKSWKRWTSRVLIIAQEVSVWYLRRVETYQGFDFTTKKTPMSSSHAFVQIERSLTWKVLLRWGGGIKPPCQTESSPSQGRSHLCTHKCRHLFLTARTQMKVKQIPLQVTDNNQETHGDLLRWRCLGNKWATLGFPP